MNNISINTERKYSATVIPNTFIDRYMASANGSYVKVFLYLLRCHSGGAMQFSITSAADFFDETENDIKRALKYWEKEGVLCLEKSGNEITGITLLDLVKNEESVSVIAPATSTPVISISEYRSNEPETKTEPASKTPVVPSYSREDIERALSNPEMRMVVNVVETYLGRLLNDSDLETITFLHNELRFSDELILHLYETCIGRNKKSNSYIQAVAINWAEAGVTNVEAAEQRSILYNAYFTAVNKAFNLGRLPGDKEQKFVKNWEALGFTPDMVKLACDKALLTTGKPSFAYADKIIKGWNDSNIKTPEDVSVAEKLRESKKPVASSKTTPTVSKSAQAYNNRYQQRNYSEEDMAEIERQLRRAASGSHGE